MAKSEHKRAWAKAQKALKWLVISGTALTLLNTAKELLEAVQSGTMDWKSALVGLVYAVLFAAINTSIYYIHERQDIPLF